MKIIALFLALISFSAIACWKVEGTVGLDGETYKINQKFDHEKEYSISMGTFILNMTLNSGKGKTHKVRYTLFEKKGIKLTLITKGDDELTEGLSKEIYAKGEGNQPNTILTLNLKNI